MRGWLTRSRADPRCCLRILVKLLSGLPVIQIFVTLRGPLGASRRRWLSDSVYGRSTIWSLRA
jgi:hypothetical protein